MDDNKIIKELLGENKSIGDKIVEAVKKKMDADEYMTSAISALEELDWDECMSLSQRVLDLSCSIEQRLAATFVFYLAVERNELNTSAWLAIAYQYE